MYDGRNILQGQIEQAEEVIKRIGVTDDSVYERQIERLIKDCERWAR
jgi:hypothetical protein